ncbi:hypothetical protein BDV12DRAFT_168402 [Aspergillus spectabilis]
MIFSDDGRRRLFARVRTLRRIMVVMLCGCDSLFFGTLSDVGFIRLTRLVGL